jgi:hypothetical protein
MKLRVATYDFEVHTTPLEKFSFTEAGDFLVEFDDVKEKRVRVKFEGGGVALRITLTDCFDPGMLKVNGRFPRRLLEVVDSPWIRELAENFRQSNPYDDLMTRVCHFILPLGDNVVEVAAWKYEIE